MIVTIDGPAGAGKSTVGKRLARRLGYRFFESGLVYRALAVKVLRAGVDPEEKKAVLKLIPGLGELASDPEFYLPETTQLASVLSADPEVRERLMGIQRQMGEGGGLVVEGRDMGSVVFPEAEIKFFLDATLEKRAQRRYQELKEAGMGAESKQVEAEIRERDQRDSSRSVSPLIVPPGAVVVDTTGLDVEAVVNQMLKVVEEWRVRGAGNGNSGDGE